MNHNMLLAGEYAWKDIKKGVTFEYYNDEFWEVTKKNDNYVEIYNGLLDGNSPTKQMYILKHEDFKNNKYPTRVSIRGGKRTKRRRKNKRRSVKRNKK